VKTSSEQPVRWLFKEEPDHYSYADLERDRTTLWEGVKNNLARRNLRRVQPGDRVLYYHTGKEKAVVGEMRVLEVAMPDAEGDVVVKVEAVRRWPKPLTLARIKQEAALAQWELVRLPRLSVVPVTEEQWARLRQLSTDS
jgi:predicted RNA-binding protein with PUA-like domain